MRTPAELTTRFRERGLEVTPQRVAIFEALHGNGVSGGFHVVRATVSSTDAARVARLPRAT